MWRFEWDLAQGLAAMAARAKEQQEEGAEEHEAAAETAAKVCPRWGHTLLDGEVGRRA